MVASPTFSSLKCWTFYFSSSLTCFKRMDSLDQPQAAAVQCVINFSKRAATAVVVEPTTEALTVLFFITSGLSWILIRLQRVSHQPANDDGLENQYRCKYFLIIRCLSLPFFDFFIGYKKITPNKLGSFSFFLSFSFRSIDIFNVPPSFFCPQRALTTIGQQQQQQQQCGFFFGGGEGEWVKMCRRLKWDHRGVKKKGLAKWSFDISMAITTAVTTAHL